MRLNAANGWDDEDSRAIYIQAGGVEAAERWGHQIAEAFFAWLHGDATLSWRARGYASWIERDPAGSFEGAALAALPQVADGEFPEWKVLLGRDAP